MSACEQPWDWDGEEVEAADQEGPVWIHDLPGYGVNVFGNTYTIRQDQGPEGLEEKYVHDWVLEHWSYFTSPFLYFLSLEFRQ